MIGIVLGGEMDGLHRGKKCLLLFWLCGNLMVENTKAGCCYLITSYFRLSRIEQLTGF